MADISKFDALLATCDLATCERKATSNDQLILRTNTADEYRKLTTLLRKEVESKDNSAAIGRIQFHTYQLKSDEPFVVFIRHLHPSTSPEEIGEELSMVGHNARRVTNVRIRKKINDQVTIINLPLYRVELEPKENNREVLDLKTILYTKVKVELPKKIGSVPQCKKYQAIGHSQNYCQRTPRCVKCGENHLSTACTKPRESKSRCANCNEEHTANYKGCRVYQAKLAPLQKAKTSALARFCLLYTSPSPRDRTRSRMPSSA